MALGLNDFGFISQRSFDGWFWGALPAFFVGLWIRWMALGAIHISDRAKQIKRPYSEILAKSLNAVLFAVGYVIVLVGLLAISIYFILRKTSALEVE